MPSDLLPSEMADASASCATTLERWSAALRGRRTPAVVLTYASQLPPFWLLGLSAALHDVPVVVVGFGASSYGDNSQKALGTMRAAAKLRGELDARTVLLVVDAWDTLVVNSPRRVAAELAQLADAEGSVLLSSECNSWPRCYRDALARDAELRECLAAPGRTCFVNGGMYGATPASIVDGLLPALSGVRRRDLHYAERTSESAAEPRTMHRARRSAHSAPLTSLH